jgi:phosphoenolpyruvate carboxykinase (ATP)
MNDRVKFVESRNEFKGGYDKLPEDALEAIKKVVSELENC